MGIKGLRTFLKKQYPEIFQTCYFETFKNKKIAVDIIGLVFSYKCCVDDWQNALKEFFMSKIKYNIQLTIVFEGKAPVEKHGEQQIRHQKRLNVRSEIVELKRDLEHFCLTNHQTPLIDHVLERLAKPRKISNAVLSKIIEGIDKDEVAYEPMSRDAIVELVKNYIYKTEKQIVSLTADDMNAVRTICDQIGLQVIEAPGEAEQMCSWLCINGYVDAVLSEDSDLIALKCPIVLSRSKTSGMVSVFSFEKMLEETKLTEDQIIDWAILCGTDYNTSLPKIGVVRALEIIQKFKSIDNFIENGHDIIAKYNITPEAIEQLKYKTVRQMYNTSVLDGYFKE
jgi:5'-3' exonuclease